MICGLIRLEEQCKYTYRQVNVTTMPKIYQPTRTLVPTLHIECHQFISQFLNKCIIKPMILKVLDIFHTLHMKYN